MPQQHPSLPFIVCNIVDSGFERCYIFSDWSHLLNKLIALLFRGYFLMIHYDAIITISVPPFQMPRFEKSGFSCHPRRGMAAHWNTSPATWQATRCSNPTTFPYRNVSRRLHPGSSASMRANPPRTVRTTCTGQVFLAEQRMPVRRRTHTGIQLHEVGVLREWKDTAYKTIEKSGLENRDAEPKPFI